MRTLSFISIILACGFIFGCATPKETTGGEWQSLFDGTTLTGWKVGENASSFSISHGAIKVNGPVAHLFYDGPIANHQFKNFELSVDVLTKPGANSGIYFHTQYQDRSWPKAGYEVQVNNSQSDLRRTASLYGIQDVKEVYAKDDKWFTERIRVEGKHIRTYINNKLIVDYTEPEHVQRDKGSELRVISSGTFALQAHDPGSTVYYKNIRVRILP